MHADPFAIHGLQFGLDRDDEHLHIDQYVPAVTAAGAGDRPGGRQRQISGAQDVGVRHRPNMVQRGRHTALCVGTDIRGQLISRTDSDVPTMTDAGIPDHVMVAWWALVAPTGTPTHVIARLAAELARIGDAPEWQSALTQQGISAMLRGPAALAALLQDEADRWGAAVRASGAAAD